MWVSRDGEASRIFFFFFDEVRQPFNDCGGGQSLRVWYFSMRARARSKQIECGLIVFVGVPSSLTSLFFLLSGIGGRQWRRLYRCARVEITILAHVGFFPISFGFWRGTSPRANIVARGLICLVCSDSASAAIFWRGSNSAALTSLVASEESNTIYWVGVVAHR